MYLCQGPVPSQESEQSCICVRGLYQARKVSSHVFVLEVSLPSLYQARKVSSHVCVLEVSLPSLYQARKVSSRVFVLGVSLPSLYQARKVCGHVFVCQGYRYQACTKPGKCVVMYLCVRGIVPKPVPSQESLRSCICVLGVSLPSLNQARRVSGHVFVCQGYRCQACTKPGKCAVMYLCVRDIVTKPVLSQQSERSCICVLGISLPSLY